MSNKPCEICGSKPNACKIIVHKRECSIKNLGDSATIPAPAPLAAPIVYAKTCCSQPMIRTDGPSYAPVCRHNRLLTAECKECRQDHHGILTYRCTVCGKTMQDSPHLAQGPEALAVSSIAR